MKRQFPHLHIKRKNCNAYWIIFFTFLDAIFLRKWIQIFRNAGNLSSLPFELNRLFWNTSDAFKRFWIAKYIMVYFLKDLLKLKVEKRSLVLCQGHYCVWPQIALVLSSTRRGFIFGKLACIWIEIDGKCDIRHANNIWSTEKMIPMSKLKVYLKLYERQNRMLRMFFIPEMSNACFRILYTYKTFLIPTECNIFSNIFRKMIFLAFKKILTWDWLCLLRGFLQFWMRRNWWSCHY